MDGGNGLPAARVRARHPNGRATRCRLRAGVAPDGWALGRSGEGATREIPNCNVRVVNLVDEPLDPAELAELVVAELYRWGLFEIAHRNGRRYTLQARRYPAGAPVRSFGPDNTVVMSGGGRGIGFALALDFATRYGARVIVTGRAPLPDPQDPVLALDEAGFAAYRADRLRAGAANRQLVTVRAELARLAAARELLQNLRTAQAAGARVQYRPCDVTEPAAVATLIEAAGPGLAGVVHNAGVDVPARLAAKTNEVAEQVIRVKVDGLLNLLAALAGRPAPAFLCTVGSLTGRWGGMVGQLDYGAANEAVSYLSRWAAGRFPASTSVRTLAWPTWDRLGLITNYEATLQYMSALDVAEGVELWERELVAAGSGEVSYIGDVGPAIAPTLIRGYSARSQLPGIERLASALYFLGEPLTYRPGELVSYRVALVTPGLTLHTDFRIDGLPAAPISLVLEHLISAGAWVLDGPEPLQPVAVHDVWIGLDALRRTAHSGVPVTATARRLRPGGSRRAAGTWVTVRIADPAGPLAQASVAFAARLGTPVAPPSALVDGEDRTEAGTVDAARVRQLAWNGHVFRLAVKAEPAPGADLSARVEPDRLRDMFGIGAMPRPQVSLNVIENLVRASWINQQPDSPRAFALARLTRLAPTPTGATVINNRAGDWSAVAEDHTSWLSGRDARFI